MLSQWRGYGSDGGYAIQFDSKKLRKILREFDKNENGLDIKIDKIQYGVKGKYLKKLIQFEGELNSHFDAHVRRMYKFTTGEYAVLKDYSVDLLEALAWWMTFSKSHHFSEEAEWRIAGYTPTNGSSRIKFRNSNGKIVPYIVVKSAKLIDAIDRIIVGPHEQQDLRIKTLSRLTSSLGKRIRLFPSEIPLAR